jgi:hypothetical protein
MKRSSIVLLLLSVLVLDSCGPTVFFANPQPRNTANKNSFKKNYWGNYYSDHDSTLLKVSGKIILREGTVMVSRTRSQILSGGRYEIGKDSLIEISTKKAYRYTSRNDTLEYYLPQTDTLFVVDNENLLRYYRGNYFLNYKISDKNWYVKKLSLEGTSALILSEIKVPEDISLLKNHTRIEEVGRVYQYLLDPTKAEFRKLLSNKGFSTSTRFKRLK